MLTAAMGSLPQGQTSHFDYASLRPKHGCMRCLDKRSRHERDALPSPGVMTERPCREKIGKNNPHVEAAAISTSGWQLEKSATIDAHRWRSESQMTTCIGPDKPLRAALSLAFSARSAKVQFARPQFRSEDALSRAAMNSRLERWWQPWELRPSPNPNLM